MIVSNANPLIVLRKINKLKILYQLFRKTLVPEAVHGEITPKKNFVYPTTRNDSWVFLCVICLSGLNRHNREVLLSLYS